MQRFTSSGALDSAFGTDGQVPAGSHVTIQPDGKILAGGYGDMFMARYLGDAPVPTPFNNAPLPVSAPIQCEDFDNLGYYDATPANATGQYRYTPVDIEKCGDTGGGYDVCYAKPGEWLRYTLNVTTAKTYAFQTRVAALGTGGKFHLELDGVSLGSVAVPNTGGWGTYTSVAAGSKALTAGTHTLKLVMDTAGSGGYVGNFNWIRLS